MNRSYKDILKTSVVTTDKAERAIADVLLDRRAWAARYVVLEPGGWLSGRKLLLSPAAFGRPRWSERTIPVNVGSADIEKSPPIEADLPVTLAHERALMDHYQWPPPDLEGPPLPEPLAQHLTPDTRALEDRTLDRARGQKKESDTNLYSAGALLKLSALTRDGERASLDDVLIDDQTWAVAGWVVDVRPWLPGGSAFIERGAVASVDLDAGALSLTLTRSEIEGLSAAQINLARSRR